MNHKQSIKKLRKLLQNRINELYALLYFSESLLTSLDRNFFRVCIFGSARIEKGHPDYLFVERLSYSCAVRGMDIVTGGGPGLMEAANKGAQEGRKKSHRQILSIGLPIDLPFDEPINPHLDVKRQHRRFSSRLDDFMRISSAVVVMPGGIGTLLELMFCLQLLQVGLIFERPVVLVNRNFWKGLVRWLNAEPIRHNLISRSDLRFLHLVDTIDEILPILESAKKHFDKEMRVGKG